MSSAYTTSVDRNTVELLTIISWDYVQDKLNRSVPPTKLDPPQSEHLGIGRCPYLEIAHILEHPIHKW